MSNEPIIVEAMLEAPPAVVWKAITDKDQMRQWFFEPMTEFQPEVGFETTFEIECEGQVYPHEWKVTEVVPESRISYDWRYRGYPGDSTVTWELSEVPGGTQLRLTHTGSETFPQDDPVFSRASCTAGWEFFLQDSLKPFLEGADDERS